MIPKSDANISLVDRIKDIWQNHSVEFAVNVFLVVVVIGGIIISALEFFKVKEIWGFSVHETLGAFVGGMIAFLALHFVMERFNAIWNIENDIKNVEVSFRKSNLVSELEKESKLHHLKDSTLATLKNSLEDYVNLHDLIAHSGNKNKGFEAIANSRLGRQNDLLKFLSEGKIKVLNREAFEVNELLLGKYSTFDAVSYNDLEFWTSSVPEDIEYYEVCRKHFKEGREDTRITRIFVFEATGDRDIFSNNITREYKDENGSNISSIQALIQTLEKHMDAKMAWAVAIKEEFDNNLTHSINEYLNGIPDFALFDRGKAVSFFRTNDRDGRTFEILFDLDVPGRKTKIEGIKKLYFRILGNCWLVNKHFTNVFLPRVEKYSDKQKVKENLLKNIADIKSTLSDKELSDIFGKELTDGNFFPLVVNSKEEIGKKVNALNTLVKSWRKNRGAASRQSR